MHAASEADRHAMVSVQELAVDALRTRLVHFVLRCEREDLLQQDAAFELAEVLADALVRAMAEGEAAPRAARDVEDVCALELLFVAVAGGPEEHHALSRLQLVSANLDGLLDEAAEQVIRYLEEQKILGVS